MKRKTFIFIMCIFLAKTFFCVPAYAQDKEYRSTINNALDRLEKKVRPDLGDSDSKDDSSISRDSVEKKDENVLEPPTLDKNADNLEIDEVKEEKRDRIIIDVLELKNMDISDVLKLISKKSGLNIVKGRNVKGNITIYLKNVDVRDALRIIVESNDMAYAEEEGIIRVMTAKDYELTFGRKFGDKTEIKIIQLLHVSASDASALLAQVKSIVGKVIPDSKSNTLILIDTADRLKTMELLLEEVDIPLKTKVFNLSYAKAEEVSSKITEVLTANVGSLKFDVRSNKIVITDTPKNIERIEEIIAAFDEKHKEVLIEAKIIRIILSDQYKLGIDWEAIVSDFHTLTLKNDFDILSSTDKEGQLSIGTLSGDDYTVLLEALDTIGTTNILSSPSITAINNEEAKILVGSTEPYVTTTTTTPATGATTTAESVNFIDVGVKLYVTPTIHNDDYITMKIKPEVSSVTRFLTTSNNNTIPVVETSEAETTVMVKNGVTIVIGGLIKEELIETVNKVPLLGDIPFLGMVFQNKDSLKRKTEVVIFLSPHIISGDVDTGRHLNTF